MFDLIFPGEGENDFLPDPPIILLRSCCFKGDCREGLFVVEIYSRKSSDLVTISFNEEFLALSNSSL